MKKATGLILSGVLAASALATAQMASPATPAIADPFGCTSTGYLLQVPAGASTSDMMQVDLNTGNVTTTSTLPSNVNAGGFSELDGYIYVWDDDNQGIGRIDSVGSYTFLGAVTGATLPATIHRGDVSSDGYLWLSQGTQVFRVDVRPDAVRAPSEPFLEAVAMPALAPPLTDHKYSQDWVQTPTNPDLLYLTSFNDSRKEFALYTYSMSTGVTTSLGILARSSTPPLPNMNLRHGALFADASGMIYASENRSGIIQRIDPSLPTPEIFFFSNGPASRDNDGVFCRTSLLPVDYGDAPASYGTMFADNGPRHSILGPDSSGNTSTLAIGTTVTPDADGKPVNLDEDDAFASNPTIARGLPGSLEVPVTNDLGEEVTLYAWYDADQDGAFSAAEALTPQVAAAGQTSVTITLPPVANAGDAWLRLRLVPSDIDPTTLGGSVYGEVEDWPVQIAAPAPGPTPQPDPEPTVDPGPDELSNTGTTDAGLGWLAGLAALALGGVAIARARRRSLGDLS